MKVKIMPGKVGGTVSAPPSKSYTHRSIIIASLAKGISVIRNPLISDDTTITIEACRKLGAKITAGKNCLIIGGVNGRFPAGKSVINIFCGFSGTTMRLMTAVSALTDNKVIIDGEDRLRERPMKDLLTALKASGINIKSVNGDNHLPLCLNGGELGVGTILVRGSLSSQFISALLLISPFAAKDTTIVAEDLKSKPYVDITVGMMKTFGTEVEKSGKIYKVAADQKYKARQYTVEGDYSSASYFLAAGAVTRSKVTVNNLNPDSVQGDKYFLEVLEKMKRNTPGRINFNLRNCPDIVPTVAVVAANRAGETVITDIKHLRTKESDRIHSVASQLSKMGIKVKTANNELVITGGKLKAAEIETFNDHRIAMSFAVAGLTADGTTVINNAEVVNKSYPDFWQDFAKIGAGIKII